MNDFNHLFSGFFGSAAVYAPGTGLGNKFAREGHACDSIEMEISKMSFENVNGMEISLGRSVTPIGSDVHDGHLKNNQKLIPQITYYQFHGFPLIPHIQ